MNRMATVVVFLLGSIYMTKGQDGADSILQEVLNLRLQAEAQVERGNLQQAMVFLDKALEVSDTNRWTWLDKAELEFKQSGPTEALHITRWVNQTYPRFGEGFNRSSTYYRSRGDLDTALIMANVAIKLATSDTMRFVYRSNRASIKAYLKDYEGAKEDFEAVLGFDSLNLAALNNLASLYDDMGNKAKSIELLERALAIDSSFVGPYVNLGFLYSSMDDPASAIDYFAMALAIDPDEALIYSNRGHAYYQLGDYAAALNDLNKSISMYPTNSYAYRNLALVYLAMESPREACSALAYAQYYGFQTYYGNEVEELIATHCIEKFGSDE